MVQVLSKSEAETKKIGQKLGQIIKKNKGSVIIGLIGDLGGGKTTFVKGIASGLGVKGSITSPTFTLLKEYKTKDLNLYHFDFYRLKDINDAKNLGLEEYFEKSRSIVIIEWADRIKNILPDEKIIIEFDFISQNERRLTLKAKGKIPKELIKKINF